MTKYGRERLRGKPLSPECYSSHSSGVEFYDEKGNGYCGCYGLMDDPDNYNPECLECGALAWAITDDDVRRAARSMSATDELRCLLDERGVEWWEGWDKDLTCFDGAFGVRYVVDCTLGKMFVRTLLPVTPEQAIAATLGREACEMTVIDTDNEAAYEHHEYIMHCEHCHFEFGLVQYNEDGDTWQDEKPNYCPNCGRKAVSA